MDFSQLVPNPSESTDDTVMIRASTWTPEQQIARLLSLCEAQMESATSDSDSADSICASDSDSRRAICCSGVQVETRTMTVSSVDSLGFGSRCEKSMGGGLTAPVRSSTAAARG